MILISKSGSVMQCGSKQHLAMINSNSEMLKSYSQMKVREGSLVKMKKKRQEYYHGFNNKMETVLGSSRVLVSISPCGEIKFSGTSTETMWTYNISDVLEVIKY